MKDLIFVVGFFVTVPVGIVAAYLSPRIREFVFFAMVFSTTTTHRLDINFMSREMYRGSTRGIEFSYFDFLSVVLLVSCLLAPQGAKKLSRWPAGLGFLLAYVAYCVFNIAICDPKLFGMFEFVKILRGLVVFLAVALYVSKPRDLAVLALGLCAATIHVTGVAFVERYLWGVNRIPGPFEHSNEFSQYCCIAAPVLAAVAASDRHAYIRWLCMACAAALGICVILTICRTGVATYAFVMMCVVGMVSGLALTPRKAVVGVLILIGAAAVVYKASDSLMSRYSGTSLEDEYFGEDTQGRGMYLRIAAEIVRDHPLGIGLNNWSYIVSEVYYPRIGRPSVSYDGTDVDTQSLSRAEYTHMLAVPAHNLAALTIGELGVPGFIIFYLMWGRWFQMGLKFVWERRPQIVSRYGLGAFFGLLASFFHCMTEYGFRHVHIFFLVHILAGALSAAYAMPDVDAAVSRLIRQRLLALRRARAMEAE